MNVLYTASEVYPFIKTGGLADVAGSLPKALSEAGAQIRVILPLYESIADRYKEQMEFVMYTYVTLAWRRQYCGLFKLELDEVIYYFVDNEYYFKRPAAYGYFDDAERFAFFSRSVYGLIPLLKGFKPDVVHSNDWQTAPVSIYIREDNSEFYKSIKTVFTIHNIEYQGEYGVELLEDIYGLPRYLYENGTLAFIKEYRKDINLMKGALYLSDYVTTVSPTYAQELKNPYYAHGLHLVIQEISDKMRGILNGIDNSLYNPAVDKNLYKNFSAKALSTKAENKKELQHLLSLKVDENIPIIACISRLVTHKGFDLILSVLDEIMEGKLQLVVLGTGEWNFEQSLLAASHRYPGKLSANIMYSDALASQIYGAADMLLMPSMSEPCGLSQMIAMRYGTVPIVRETGGLKDSVSPYRSEYSTGFTFTSYSAQDMLYVIREALKLYYEDRKSWDELVIRCMKKDFSWKNSAEEYLEVYDYIVGE